MMDLDLVWVIFLGILVVLWLVWISFIVGVFND